MRQQSGPTPEQFRTYQAMFDYYNRQLFDSKLPKVLLVFTRHVKAAGYFAPGRWAGMGEAGVHEISLHPDLLISRPPKEVASTLVHEMVHLWQQTFGKPGRRGYHNRQWSKEMIRVGLMPSTTGAPGGARVGEPMSHYVLPGGPFEVAFEKARAQALPWGSLPRGPASRSKVKYSCPGCHTSAWGKPGLQLDCRPCGLPLVPTDESG